MNIRDAIRNLKSGNPKRKSSQRLSFEKLEDKQLLTTIIWDNPNPATNGFDTYFGANADLATDIVNHAIEVWEGYIDDFNYQDVGTTGNAPVANTYNVMISAAAITNEGVLGATTDFQYDVAEGKPFASTIYLDNNAAGNNWYFDPNVLSDTEFTQINTPFSADTTGPNTSLQDLFTVTLHELGHAIGFTGHITAPPNELMNPELTTGNRRLVSDNTLTVLTTPAPFGAGRTYTLSSATATDNLHVSVHGGDLFVRGLRGTSDDAVQIYKASNGDMIAKVNGFVERTHVSQFDDLDIKTWGGDDAVTIAHSVELFDNGANVDTGHGNDRFLYWTPQDSGSYGTVAKDDYVHRYYKFVGPSPYERNYFANVETLQLKGGDSADEFFVHTNDAALVQVFAEGGDDSIDGNGSTTPMRAWGHDGNDTIYGTDVVDILRGGDGDDTLHGWKGNDLLYGDDGDDVIFGQQDNDYIRGGNGDDLVNGNAGNDSVYGDAGFDTVVYWGTSADDYMTTFVAADGSVRSRTQSGSYSGPIIEADSFFTDVDDFMLIRAADGDDHIKVHHMLVICLTDGSMVPTDLIRSI